MGGNVGRVITGVVTLGISELVRAIVKSLSPEQQREYHECDRALQDLEAKRQALQDQTEEMAMQQEAFNEASNAVQNSVEDFTANEERMFEKHLELVAKLPDPPKTQKRSVAFMGRTSAGKSTLINKLFDTDCRTSALACTKGVSVVFNDEHLEVIDIFGHNDDETYHNAKTLLVGKTLHIIVVVFNNCVEDCLRLARLTKALKVPAVFFRNNFTELSSEDEIAVQEHEAPKLRAISPGFRLISGSAKTGLRTDELKSLLRTVSSPL